MTRPEATLLQGDVLDRLRELPDASVHCVVTSPPYWNLRDYGVAGQIGLEDTVGEWVARIVEVFAEVRRVLRPDGTLWLNLGDSYAGTGKTGGGDRGAKAGPNGYGAGAREGAGTWQKPPAGLKIKDLIGQPWRVAFALQADGWWLRSEIIWHKNNPAPESAPDRPTRSHEQVFLLSRSARYFYDDDAIKEPAVPRRRLSAWSARGDGARDPATRADLPGGGGQQPAARKARTVWTIATQSYAGAHFATFPEGLVRPCILAGTSERGVCPACAAPWARVVAKGGGTTGADWTLRERDSLIHAKRGGDADWGDYSTTTLGWQPTCGCQGLAADAFLDSRHADAAGLVPATVLDPFAGSGTTLTVALRYGRHAIGIELNPEYVKLAARRLAEARRAHGIPLFDQPQHTP